MNPLVTIWTAELDELPGWEEAGIDWLAAEEEVQANRFVNPRDARRFRRRRLFRRAVLAEELKIPPERLRFTTGPQGKPSLAPDLGRLEFNATHSAGRALIAVGRRGPLGIDFEKHRSLRSELEGVSGFFAQAEQAELAGFPESQRDAAFFAVWTRKEAVLKASGRGLSQALDSFVVPAAPKAPAGWISLGSASSPWWLQSLPVGPGASAALATRPKVDVQWQTWQWR